MTIRKEIEKIKTDKPSLKSVVNFLNEEWFYYNEPDNDAFKMIERVTRTKDEIKLHLQTIIESIEKEFDYYIAYLPRYYDNERDIACIKECQVGFDEKHDIMIGLYKIENGYTLMFDYKQNNK